MPELPEVETMRRGILGAVGGRLVEVERLACPRKPINLAPRIDAFRRRTAGQAIDAIDRIGKRVVLRLGSGDAIVIEPRMTGLVLTRDPPDPLYLRLRFLVSGRAAGVLYWDRRGLGQCRLLSPAFASGASGRTKLGPDALTVTAELFRERLGGGRARDQGGAARSEGGGWASAISTRPRFCTSPACIRPARCDTLTRPIGERIADATLAVLEEAIRYEGSTLSDGTYRNALNQAGGYQNQHRVYDRAGEPCVPLHGAD